MPKVLFWILGAFLAIRLVINIGPKPLSIFFAASYAVLLFLLFKYPACFTPLLIGFLLVDSMIGTYLFTSSGNLGFEYYATMGVNIFFAIAALYAKR